MHLLFGLSGDYSTLYETRYYLTAMKTKKRSEEKSRRGAVGNEHNVTHIKRGLAALIAKSHEEIRNTVHILGSTQPAVRISHINIVAFSFLFAK